MATTVEFLRSYGVGSRRIQAAGQEYFITADLGANSGLYAFSACLL
jgi:hypothetical protein